MSRRLWCLRMLDPAGWQAMDLNGETRILEADPGQPSPSPEAVWSAFQELRYDGVDVLLALPSGLCLTGRIPAAQIPPRCDDKTKLFLLEDALPVPAEEVTADFISGDSGTMGVAVITEAFRPTVEQLENLGLNIQSIVPWSLLAAQEWMKSRSDADVLVGKTRSGFELVETSSGLASGWCLVGTEADLRWRLSAIADELGRPLVVVSDFPQPAWDSNQWLPVNSPWDESAGLAAGRVLAGAESPLVDLRRDRLAGTAVPRAVRGYLRAFQLTTALLLITMLAGVLWQGVRYQQIADDLVVKQQQVFQRVLPGQPVPPGIRSRLESELSRLKTQQDSAAKVPGRDSALLTLVHFLEAVPTSLRLKVNGLSVSGHQVTVRSEVRTPGDGSAFVQALRESGFNARSPRSVRSGDSYSVDFDAQLASSPASRKAEP